MVQPTSANVQASMVTTCLSYQIPDMQHFVMTSDIDIYFNTIQNLNITAKRYETRVVQ